VGGRLEAQAVSLSAGYSSWTCCLADRGGAAVAVRLDVPIGSVLLLEPGATWLRLGNQAQPPHETHFVLELSVQARLPIGGPVAPFLGVGAGLPTNVAGDFFVAAHVVAGLRRHFGRGWYVRGEFRAREASPVQGDLTVGIGRQF
jgi:hypothetical protein